MVQVYLPTRKPVPTKIIATRKLSWLDIAEKRFNEGHREYFKPAQWIYPADEIQMYLAIMSYYGMFE